MIEAPQENVRIKNIYLHFMKKNEMNDILLKKSRQSKKKEKYKVVTNEDKSD